MQGSDSHEPTSIDKADSLVLFRRAKDGDARACEAFFARYTPHVHHLAQQQMGHRVRALAESADIAQDTLVEAVEDLDALQVEGRSHLRRLFARMVKHRISAICRHYRADRRDRDREQPIDYHAGESSDGMIEHATVGPGPLESLERMESLDNLRECIAELRPEHRQVVSLRLLRRRSWEAVAQELGRTTPDAARMLHRRAMLDLRRLMRQRQRDEPA